MMSASSRISRAVKTVFRMASSSGLPRCGSGETARSRSVSRETVRRLALAGVLPHTVVCHGTRKTTRRYPRRFAEEFAASGLEVADLAAFAVAWRARVAAPAR